MEMYKRWGEKSKIICHNPSMFLLNLKLKEVMLTELDKNYLIVKVRRRL